MKLGFAVAPLFAGPRDWSGLLPVLPPPTTLPSRIVSQLKTVTSFLLRGPVDRREHGRVFGHQVPPKSSTVSLDFSVFRR